MVELIESNMIGWADFLAPRGDEPGQRCRADGRDQGQLLRSACTEAGMNDCTVKPMPVGVLYPTVLTWLDWAAERTGARQMT